MGVDLKYFYLNTPMVRYEYMQIPITILPQEIIKEYDIDHLIDNRFILPEIKSNVLSITGRSTNLRKLAKNLDIRGYRPTLYSLYLFKHQTRKITFCLVVNNVSIKFIHQHNPPHLVNHFNKEYKATVSWEGKVFYGMHLDWDYITRTLVFYIKNYDNKSLKGFQHIMSKYPEHSPHPFIPLKYGAKQ